MFRFRKTVFLLCLALVACASATPTPTTTPSLEPTATSSATPFPPTATPTPQLTATPETYTADELSQMTDAERQKVFDTAPQIDGLTKSNFSENKINLIVYRDEEGIAQKVFNLTTGKELTLQDAGIVELPQTDGGTLELLSFQTAEELIKFIISEDVVWGNGGENDRRIYMEKIFFKNFNPTAQEQALFDELNKLEDSQSINFEQITLPQPKKQNEPMDFFGIVLEPVGHSALTHFENNNKIRIVVHCNMNITNLYNALKALEDSFFTTSN